MSVCDKCNHNSVCGYQDDATLACSDFQKEVVRCKDCKHYVDGPYDNGDMMCDCWGEWIFPNEDDFCSYGERKDNDT